LNSVAKGRAGDQNQRSMARAGQTIEHPTLGVNIRFIKTHRETDGIGWEAEYTIAPGKGRQYTPHTHLRSDEWFRVIKGQCKYWLNGKIYKAYAGDEIYFPANIPHIHPWNYCDIQLVLHNTILINNTEKKHPEEIRKLEEYYENWFSLACCGKVRKDGMPKLLQSAVLLRTIRKHVVMAKLPVLLQDIIMPPLALAGRLKGY